MSVGTLNRKDQILETSRNLFREKGYSATSMREIAKTVGIEPASLYSHFESKDEILKTICFKIADEFMEVFEPIHHSMASPVEKMKRAFTEHINVVISNLDASAVFFNEWRHMKEPGLSKFISLREEYEQGFKEVVQEGITLCEFKNRDIRFTIRLIFSVLNGVHDWYDPEGKVSPEEVGEMMSEFILEGLTV